jgi:hypothetical protein
VRSSSARSRRRFTARSGITRVRRGRLTAEQEEGNSPEKGVRDASDEEGTNQESADPPSSDVGAKQSLHQEVAADQEEREGNGQERARTIVGCFPHGVTSRCRRLTPRFSRWPSRRRGRSAGTACWATCGWSRGRQ